MKTIATTKIQCPASKQRHAVTIRQDGSAVCDCDNGVERGQFLAGRIALGMPPPEGVRGCGALIAMIDGADSLLRLDRGTFCPEYGPWGELVFAYGKNPVYRAALDLAERKHPERIETRRLLVEAAERAGYRHKLGKRRFRDEFKAIWDVPATVEALDKFIVSAFDDDPWMVPYMPGWKEQISDKGLAVVSGKLVCGRSVEDPNVLYAVTVHEHGEAHWVRPHRLSRGRLVEVAS